MRLTYTGRRCVQWWRCSRSCPTTEQSPAARQPVPVDGSPAHTETPGSQDDCDSCECYSMTESPPRTTEYADSVSGKCRWPRCRRTRCTWNPSTALDCPVSATDMHTQAKCLRSILEVYWSCKNWRLIPHMALKKTYRKRVNRKVQQQFWVPIVQHMYKSKTCKKENHAKSKIEERIHINLSQANICDVVAMVVLKPVRDHRIVDFHRSIVNTSHKVVSVIKQQNILGMIRERVVGDRSHSVD